MTQSQFENYYFGLEWPYTPSFPSMFLMWIYCPTSNFLTEAPFIKSVPACMINHTLSLIHLICKHWNNIFNGKGKIPLKVLKRWSQESWSPKENKPVQLLWNSPLRKETFISIISGFLSLRWQCSQIMKEFAKTIFLRST